MHKIVTPVSHLFFNEKNANKISKYSDFLEIRYRTINLNFKNEKFFHVDEDITLPWTKNFKLKFENIIKKKKNLKYLTFQSSRCCLNEQIKKHFFIISGRKFSRKEMLVEAKKNMNWLNQKFNSKFTIGLENNNYYPSKAYNIIADADFISQVVRENKMFFLFDIAHAKVTAANKDIDYQNYIDQLPLDLMKQIHICRPFIKKKNAKDTHFLPNKEIFDEIKFLANKYKKLKFFTIEYYKDPDKLVNNIKKLKKILNI